MSARTPGSFDGSLATVITVSAMPFQVSGSAIATVPATVLINPVVRPTWKSVYTVNASARAPPTSSPSSSSKWGRTQSCSDVTASPMAEASSSSRPTKPLTWFWKFSSTVPTSRATSRRMSSASPVKTPFTMSHAPPSEILSSNRRMASWVSCTPPAKSSIDWARPEAVSDRFDTACPSLSRTWPIFPPSGICCSDTRDLTGETASSKIDRPWPRFRHCVAVSRIIPELPDGHVSAAPANIPPGNTLRNGTIRCHLVGGDTVFEFGPVAASPALVSLGSLPTPPVGPGPPTVDAASAFA